jgi:hypothetical protein
VTAVGWNIWEAEPYVRLMASLPSIGLLGEKKPPINRARLMERLKALTPEHRAEYEAARSILSWESIALGDDDAAFLDRVEQVLPTISGPDLRAAIIERLELRTAIAALRRRHDGEEAPALGVRWGYGRHVGTIRANWTLPDFGLGRTYPWLARAKEMLERGETADLERLALEEAWAAIDRRARGHAFDAQAVGFYIMRWALADRWARYDAEAAAVRFGEMLDAAIDGAGLTAEETA